MAPLQITTLLVLISLAAGMAEHSQEVRTNYKPYSDTWVTFKRDFGRSYRPEEESKRYEAFVKTLQKIEAHNQAYLDGKESYTMDINGFADMLDSERRFSCHVDVDTELNWARYKRETRFCRRYSPKAGDTLPSSKDWRKDGVVPAVRDQGDCGSCYAFGVTTTIAAQLKLKAGGRLTPMSEQQLVDCFKKSCKGSNAIDSFKYISDVGGIMSSANYPYRRETYENGTVGRCEFNKARVAAKVSGCLSSSGEANLKHMVASEGPVFVRVFTINSFYGYKTGVYSDSKCNERFNNGNHCVTVIGYGRERGKDYWLVQNSWGTEHWGQRGYGKIERGKNMCGIGDMAFIPEVTAPDINKAANDGSSRNDATNDPTTHHLSWLTVFSVSLAVWSTFG